MQRLDTEMRMGVDEPGHKCAPAEFDDARIRMLRLQPIVTDREDLRPFDDNGAHGRAAGIHREDRATPEDRFRHATSIALGRRLLIDLGWRDYAARLDGHRVSV
jgi:hypothetical protein